MSKGFDFLAGSGGVEKSTPHLIEVEIDTNCEECFAPADKVYYNKENKRLIVICENNHERSVQGNWSWIADG